jgi:hypothetical protein
MAELAVIPAVAGPPAGARHVKQVWVLRGLTQQVEGQRHGSLRAWWDRQLEDRWVVGYLHDDLWWVTVQDGRGRVVEQLPPTSEVAAAALALHGAVEQLLAEGAASSGRWIPAPGREYRRAAA